MRQYGINVERTSQFNEWSDSITCPFPFHKGGNERTASFGYNFTKGTFHCFGCNASGGSVEFIAFKESITKTSAAEQIIHELGGYDIEEEESFEDVNPKIEALLFDFSAFIQGLNQKHKHDPNVMEQIDKVSWWFDHYLIAKAPKSKIFVEELEERVSKAKELLEDFV